MTRNSGTRMRDGGQAGRRARRRPGHSDDDNARRSRIVHPGRLLGLFALAVGCSGPPPAPTPVVPVPELTADRCAGFRERRKQLIAAARHDVVQLVAYRWPQQAPRGEGTRVMVAEDALARRLARAGGETGRGMRTVLIEGRGGSGKSRLAWSIAAQTCDKRAVVRLDASRDIAAHLDSARDGHNLVLDILARSAGLKNDDPSDAELFQALGGRPLLVLLDSLDAVPAPKREMVVSHLNDLLDRKELHASIVALTRPPVFSDYLGLEKVDAHLELPPLTCDRARALCNAKLYTDAERFNFWDFVRRHKLDRRVEVWGRCSMPHLASYRDLILVRRLASNVALGRKRPDGIALLDTRTAVYEAALRLELEKDLDGSTTDPALAIAIADAMVEVKHPDAGQRDPVFSREDCLQALRKVGKGAGEETCDHVLHSSLFRQRYATGAWHFDNQGLADLFAARWSAGELRGEDGGVRCGPMKRLAPLLQSNETLGFLVGLPEGAACLSDVVATMCRHGAMSHSVVEQLDVGLPAGEPRDKALAEARRKLTGSGVEPCAGAILNRLLDKTPPNPLAPATPAAPPGG